MAFLDGIFGRGAQQAQNQQQQPQLPAGGSPPASMQAQSRPANSQMPNGNPSGAQPQFQPQGQPGQQPQNPGAGQDQNPLDGFMQLLQGDPNQRQQQQQQQKPTGLFGNIDPKVLQQQVSQSNFVQGLDQQKVHAALSGDQNAFMEVLNGVAQSVFMQNLQMTQGLASHSANWAQEQVTSGLDSRMRDFMLKQQTPQSGNKALQHPVGQAFFKSIAQQIANANPGMNPQEVARLAEEQLISFASNLAGSSNQNSNQQQSQPQGTNWLDYLNG